MMKRPFGLSEAASNLTTRAAASNRSMKISANMAQPPWFAPLTLATRFRFEIGCYGPRCGPIPRGRDTGLKLGLNLLGDFLEISACGSIAGAARAVAQLARPAARRDRRLSPEILKSIRRKFRVTHRVLGRRWLGHSRSRVAACADVWGIASWPE